MKLYKRNGRVVIEHEDLFFETDLSWDELVNHKNLFRFI
ncbi:MAG: 2-hydroxyhepta-2,4-diene-1,7-dioate isomerase, partial [Chitinophagia bacterium]|nr:2-hydroxyhepta-2,4-diene-1,7-dioate isomerase [Chitinophagia bacterium]